MLLQYLYINMENGSYFVHKKFIKYLKSEIS